MFIATPQPGEAHEQTLWILLANHDYCEKVEKWVLVAMKDIERSIPGESQKETCRGYQPDQCRRSINTYELQKSWLSVEYW